MASDNQTHYWEVILGEAVFNADVPFLSQQHRVAVVICLTEYGNLHSGLLYRAGYGEKVIHLGWQDHLCNNWPWSKLWAAPEVEPERLVSISGICRRIWKRFEKTKNFLTP